MTKPKTRRLAKIMIGGYSLTELIKRISKSSLPKDVKYHHCFFHNVTDSWALVIESKEFDEIDEGGELPEKMISMRLPIKDAIGLEQVTQYVKMYLAAYGDIKEKDSNKFTKWLSEKWTKQA